MTYQYIVEVWYGKTFLNDGAWVVVVDLERESEGVFFLVVVWETVFTYAWGFLYI